MKDIKNIIQGLVDIGIPINVIARQVGKDGSTIGKWLRNQTNISNSLESELYALVKKLDRQWRENLDQ